MELTGQMHPKFLTLNRCRCRRHNSVSICCCIQGQKVRLGTLEQLEALEQLDQRVLQVGQVGLGDEEEEVQLEQLATGHERVHRDILVIEAFLDTQVTQVDQVNTTVHFVSNT